MLLIRVEIWGVMVLPMALSTLDMRGIKLLYVSVDTLGTSELCTVDSIVDRRGFSVNDSRREIRDGSGPCTWYCSEEMVGVMEALNAFTL